MSLFKNTFFNKKEKIQEGIANERSWHSTVSDSPFYFKTSIILIGLFFFFYILYLLRDALVPVCYAVLISVLLNPMVNFFIKRKIPKVVAILIAIFIAVIIIGAIAAFISTQLAHFGQLGPQVKSRGLELLANLQNWVQETFQIPLTKQNAMLQAGLKSSQSYLGQTLGTIFSIIGVVVLIPIYTFLILYYKPLFLNFFYEVFEDRHEKKVAIILNETKNAIQSYIVGLLIENAIVAVLNSIALFSLGVKYAILLGIIGALLNLIPYIGGVIAIALPVLMSFVTGDGGYLTPLLIIVSYSIIQFIDNNFLVPRIVSSKVDVNAFVTIIIIILGGSFWGVSGMFLAIPFIAVCKIIFDRVPELKPWGKLLGVKIDTDIPNKVVSRLDKEEEN